jgi:hypothetical protein
MATRGGNGKFQRAESTLIFRTVHGSHLYGMAHEDSDMDIYEVYEGQGTHLNQTITEHGLDICVGTLEAFTRRANSGSHQSAEALFSPVKEFTSEGAARYGAYLAGFRITGSEVFAKYERTIHKFCFGDFKRRRHAARLALNLADLRLYGRFNPRLTQANIEAITFVAATLEGDDLWTALTK